VPSCYADFVASTTPATPTDAVPEISRGELRARVESRDPDLVLIDVLPADSFAASHIPTARNLPSATMTEASVRAALPDLHADLVLYCGGFT